MRLRAGLGLVVAALWLLVSGCAHQGDSVVLAGDGSRLSADEIDRDPLALLPAGVIALVHADVQAAYASPVGEAAANLVTGVLPMGPETNFDARRDVRRVVLGVYSLQGADLAMVVQGTFDTDAIGRAMAHGAPTLMGAPFTKLTYAGNDLYIAGGLGFTVVTRRTLVAGNETGMRRVLDRVRDKRVKREIPDWMAQLVDSPKASIVGVADLAGQAPVAAAAQQMPFLGNLKMARVLGNFQPPGINFAGAMTYPDAASAAQAGGYVQRLAQLASYTSLLALIGVKPPIQDLQARVEQNDVQFILAVGSQSAGALLDALGRAVRGMTAKR
jgi:hypothetical protein